MPNQAKTRSRKFLPKFGLKFLLLVLLIVSFPLAWLASELTEHRNETRFIDNAYAALALDFDELPAGEQPRFAKWFAPTTLRQNLELSLAVGTFQRDHGFVASVA